MALSTFSWQKNIAWEDGRSLIGSTLRAVCGHNQITLSSQIEFQRLELSAGMVAANAKEGKS